MSSIVLPNMLVAAEAGRGVQPPPNPLVAAGQAVSLGNGIMALRQVQAQQAAGADFQKAITPTGQVDPVVFGNILKSDPTAALAAIQSSQSVLNNVSTRLAQKGMTLDQALKRMQYVGNATGALLASGQPVTRKQVIGSLADAMNTGILPKTEAASLAATVPDDPNEVKGWLQQKYTGAQAGIMSIVPHLNLVDTGSKIVAQNLNPISATNPAQSGATLPRTLSPGEASSLVTYQGTQGQPITTTRAVIAANGNALPTGAPAAPGTQTPSSPVVGGITPQDAAAQQTYGAKTSDMGAQVVSSAASLGQQRAALQGVMSEIDSANPGPLADTFQKIGGVVGQLGLANLSSTTATQLMKKGSAQLVVSQVGSGLGVPTDGKMEEVINSIPNIAMTPLAAKGAAAQISGLIDYKQAEAQAWTDYEKTHGPASYPQFQAEWNKQFPTASVFQFNALPHEIQARYWSSLSPAQKGAFAQSMHAAQTLGYLKAGANGK